MNEKVGAINASKETVSRILKSDYKYKVPSHQRDYSWEIDKVQQLWDDLMEARKNGQSEYFLGTIVVTDGEDDKTRIIVDGQQRLASLSMIYSAISNSYSNYGDLERSGEVGRDFLGIKNRRTGVLTPKLTMNEMNNTNYDRYIANICTDAEIINAMRLRLPKSNKILLQAIKKIRDLVEDGIKNSDGYLNFLVDLEEFISDKVVLIQVTAADDADAFLLFETLNDRGLELAPVDLLKNYIFGKSGTHIETVKSQWNKISIVLGKHNATRFIRHYWLSSEGLVRERELYREFKNKFRTQKDVLTLMTRLVNAADKYIATINSDHDIWKEYGSETRRRIEKLNMFGLVQFRPILLAALDCFNNQEVTKLLEIIIVFSVRYNLIGSLNPNVIEVEYSKVAINIRKKKTKKAVAVFNSLKEIYPDDSSFKTAFMHKEISKPSTARYILREIANKIQGNTIQSIEENEKLVTLEHIMPKSHTQHWLRYTKLDVEQYNSSINLIGNLALLEKGKNKTAARASFDEKKKVAYSKSEIDLTKKLCNFNKWGIEEIKKRQKTLAQFAVKIWSLPY